MICVIILLPFHRNTQILSHLWSTLFIMSYTAYVLPYKSLVQNTQEVFNEWTVLVACYHLFTFTEWVDDLHVQFQLGWSLLAVIVINVLINVAILIQFMLRSCINKIRLKCRKKKH